MASGFSWSPRHAYKLVSKINNPQRFIPTSLIPPRQIMHRPFSNVLRQKIVPKLFTLQPVRLFSISPCRYDSEITVCVPPMAESISEGTLNQFNKEVGDYVEQDEEIATIETDKIDVAVNAPEAGVIEQLFASEGDTVTVGQAIPRLEKRTFKFG